MSRKKCTQFTDLTRAERLDMMLVARRIRKTSLADSLHVSPSLVTHWVQGRWEISDQWARQIAAVLRQPANWLLTGEGPPPALVRGTAEVEMPYELDSAEEWPALVERLARGLERRLGGLEARVAALEKRM